MGGQSGTFLGQFWGQFWANLGRNLGGLGVMMVEFWYKLSGLQLCIEVWILCFDVIYVCLKDTKSMFGVVSNLALVSPFY